MYIIYIIIILFHYINLHTPLARGVFFFLLFTYQMYLSVNYYFGRLNIHKTIRAIGSDLK